MFVSRMTDDVYLKVIQNLTESTVLSNASSPGTKVQALTKAMSAAIGDMYKELDWAMLMSFVGFASGQYLDFFGELVGERRKASSGATITAAQRIIKFYVNSGTFGIVNKDESGVDQSFTIPAGTEIRTVSTKDADSAKYITTEAAVCDKNASYVWVSAVSEGQGSLYKVGANTLVVHNFSEYTLSTRGVLKVTNVAGISSPSDVEKDEQYRYRIINKVTASEAANQISVVLALLNVPGVSNVTAAPYARGIGTFDYYIKPVVPSAGEDLLTTCRTVLNKVKAEGISGYARYPERVGIELQTSVKFKDDVSESEKLDILANATQNVLFYLVNLSQGASFILNEVVQVVLQSSEKILDIGVSGKPIQSLWVWREGFVNDTRYRSTLVGNYTAKPTELVMYEYSISNPVRLYEQ